MKLAHCCAALLVLFATASVRAADLPGPNVPEGLGVNIHFTDPRPGEMEMLAAAGFRWVRMDFAWGGTEREKGKYDFSAYERLLKALDAHHIRALFILDYGNPLYDNGLSPSSEEGRQAFARWAAAAVRHFRNRGILWEMWNEPNIFFWKPKPDVQQYIKLALATGKAIRQAEPQELYIGPATSQIDFTFLEACFKGGLLDYWAAVSVHPYRQKAPETAAEEYAKLRKMIDQYAPKGKKIPILSAEWGYSAGWKDYDAVKQGKMLPRQFLTNLANDIPLSIWYDWHDDGADPKEPEHHFGTVAFPYHAGRNPVYDPKPAWEAARTFSRTFEGYRYSKRLDAGGPDNYVLVFVKGDRVRLAAWTTSDKPRKIIFPLPAGVYTRVGHISDIGDKLRQIKVGGAGIVLEVSDAPVYLVPQ